MPDVYINLDEGTTAKQYLKSFVRNLGFDLVAIADLQRLEDMPIGIPVASVGFLEYFRVAIMMGVQVNQHVFCSNLIPTVLELNSRRFEVRATRSVKLAFLYDTSAQNYHSEEYTNLVSCNNGVRPRFS